MVARLVAFGFRWVNVLAGFQTGEPGVDALMADVFAVGLELRPAFQGDAVEFGRASSWSNISRIAVIMSASVVVKRDFASFSRRSRRS